MRNGKTIWMLDPRFDFLLTWFEQEYSIDRRDILFVGSYHGEARRGLKTLTLDGAGEGRVAFREPEDVNKHFSQLPRSGEPINVISFTGAYLPDAPEFSTLMSAGELAVQANNKWWQAAFFRRLGIPTPATWRAFEEKGTVSLVEKLLRSHEKLLLKLPELSGGYRMASVSNRQELADYLSSWNHSGLSGGLLISEYISHSQSFAGMGIVKKDGEPCWCGVTEQVLFRDYSYEGLIYPPFASAELIREIERQTLLVGRELAALGYFGYYNVDFIWGEHGLQAVEINARFCFGTLLFACQCGKTFWSALTGGTVFGSGAFDKRLILGKIKAEEGRTYYRLPSDSDILSWYSRGSGSFQTIFCGSDKEETMEYGGFVGLFGAFLPKNADREEVLGEFWKRCLAYHSEKEAGVVEPWKTRKNH